MFGLSLTQPWASLMAVGAKKIETRSWYTRYRGQVAIHAARTWPKWCKDLCYDEPFRSALAPHFHWTRDSLALPTGAIVAVGRLTACVSTSDRGLWRKALPEPGTPEHAFGDYSDRRYAWFFEEIRPLPTPIPCQGKLGLWGVSPELAAAIEERLHAARPQAAR